MSDILELEKAVSLPTGFKIDEVAPIPKTNGTAAVGPPALGPLANFVGDWSGTGFNTIFRPDNPTTPTVLPFPVSSDNILELNLTTESLSFSPSLGSVPNRGLVQSDIFLNGVPYLQAINDVTTGKSTGIHLEPGLWMIVPSTTDPAEGTTLVRMASIPHGTTICSQGTFTSFKGAPVIPAVDITPTAGGTKIPFASQTASNEKTPRIPQDLSAFVAAGTITQAMLDDPNTVLRNHIKGQNIVETIAITISTNPSNPLFGGGTDNIAFLLGKSAPNANAMQMTATFWIETVQHEIIVPPFPPGHLPLEVKPEAKTPEQPLPTFSVRPPTPTTAPRTIVVTSTQIQYSQVVNLSFNGLTWPHVSVATLVPAGAIPVPPSAWA